jgi:hypothetical protein
LLCRLHCGSGFSLGEVGLEGPQKCRRKKKKGRRKEGKKWEELQD